MIVEELPNRYKMMALLAAWCAMRFGELAELRRGDIDLRTQRVKIRRGVVRVGGEFIVGQPKSDAGVRDVAIPPLRGPGDPGWGRDRDLVDGDVPDPWAPR